MCPKTDCHSRVEGAMNVVDISMSLSIPSSARKTESQGPKTSVWPRIQIGILQVDQTTEENDAELAGTRVSNLLGLTSHQDNDLVKTLQKRPRPKPG